MFNGLRFTVSGLAIRARHPSEFRCESLGLRAHPVTRVTCVVLVAEIDVVVCVRGEG